MAPVVDLQAYRKQVALRDWLKGVASHGDQLGRIEVLLRNCEHMIARLNHGITSEEKQDAHLSMDRAEHK